MGEQLGQNLLYANALEVVKSTDKNPKAAEILMRYLHMAKKEIDGIGISCIQGSRLEVWHKDLEQGTWLQKSVEQRCDRLRVADQDTCCLLSL